jgi:probable F420-dependent oxidoreductase
MQFMLEYPETVGADGDFFAGGSVIEIARAAEAAGFHGFAFTEHPGPNAKWLASGGHQTLDPFIGLAYVAGATTRLRLLTYLAVAPYRNPRLLAKMAASLDLVSDGRFILGMGTGYLKSEFFALGVDFEERNALFDEVLDVLPLHWSGEPFSYEGLHFSARDIVARPKPTHPIPIWIGGNAKITLRRVAERAQGWMPLSGPPGVAQTARTPELSGFDALASSIASLRELAGPRAAGLDITSAYGDPTIINPGADVDRHREAFAALEEIGVTWVTVSGAADAGHLKEFIAAFGEHYIES